MKKEDYACPHCGANTCDSSCSSNPQNQAINEGQRLKKLIPSCHLSDAAIVERKADLEKSGIFSKVINIKELPNGYDFIFDGRKMDPHDLLNYISFERGCCSSFSFALEFEPNLGPIHMSVFGSKTVKAQMKNLIKELQIGI